MCPMSLRLIPSNLTIYQKRILFFLSIFVHIGVHLFSRTNDLSEDCPH